MTVLHTYFYIVVDTQRGCHTLKFLMSVHLSVRVEQFSCHWKEFCEMLCWGLNIRIRRDVGKFQL